MSVWLGILALVTATGFCFYRSLSLKTGFGVYFAALFLITALGGLPILGVLLIWPLSIGLAVLLLRPDFRFTYIYKPSFAAFTKALPKMSDTEKAAINAGTVGWDGELFSGNPNYHTLLHYPKPILTQEEKAFIDGPVDTLLSMVSDWEITHEKMDLPPAVWQFLKKEGFFAFIIPKAYGGKAFSAYAHSEILTRIAGKSLTLASIIAVPNSLGPAELILHYGTEAQKTYYLPRLAKGEEIPCFALTGPEAGSDASSIPDVGVVCKGQHEGKNVLGIRLQWDKRYITLAPVATVLGLAFKLQDPDNLLGPETERGITCALIPVKTPGVTIGRRHFPLNIPFQNGPTQGVDVFIPLDWIIGGESMIGQGWRMLVECLTTGRAISLPATAVGAAKVAAMTSGVYSRVREQFRTSLCQFEGIQEALARVGGLSYLADATRAFTANLVDLGEKPSVPGAISKYHVTEMGRKISIDAMDIHGGKGIMLGPNNYLGRGYQGAPIAITVEGANILTRSMIIFGQGAMRCHPFIIKEIEAVQAENIEAFGSLLLQHVAFTAANFFGALLHGLSGSILAPYAAGGSRKRDFQQLSRACRAFALISDVTMLLVGGKLKFKESLSARLGDLLSYTYLTSVALKRHIDAGSPKEDEPLLDWVVAHTLGHFWHTMSDILRNYPIKAVGWALRACIMPLGKPFAGPTDKQNRQVAMMLSSLNPTRSRVIEGLYLINEPNNLLARIEETLHAYFKTEEIQKRLHQAHKDGQLKTMNFEEMVKEASALSLIDDAALAALRHYEVLRKQLIAVDDFSPEELLGAAAKREEVMCAMPRG